MQCATLNIGTGFGLIDSAALSTRLLAKNPKLSAPTQNRLQSKIAREDEPLLVKAAKSGDASAFEELVNRYETKIFRLTMNITRNREDAEDSMQDAFMKAYSHLDTFSGRLAFLHMAGADRGQRSAHATPQATAESSLARRTGAGRRRFDPARS
jgi:hypothetical protein